jgi:hypothetical protein
VSDYRVKLAKSGNESEYVLMEATPELVETRNVNYKTVDPVHAPGQIFAYVNTTARTFNISSVKLISRTQEEAERNLLYLWRLRSWTMPEFGVGGLTNDQRLARRAVATNLRNSGTISEEDRRSVLRTIQNNSAEYGTNLLGTPPAVLMLSAYSPNTQDRNKRAHIHRVPVVIQNISIPYPADTDYIPTGANKIPMPTIMTIDMTLAETHSPAEYSRFSLSQFKNGTLRNF